MPKKAEPALFDSETGEILPTPDDSVTVCFALYQQAAARNGWTQHRFITEPQRKAIKARLAEAGGMAEWREALDLASRSEWLCGKIIGKNGTRFKMDLNFLIQPSKFAKVLEGFYTRDEGPATQKLTLPAMQPPHLKPQPAFVPEPRPVRLASMIASYRKHGKYADANRIETELAALENRPAVHVPDPSVAFTSGAAQPQARSGHPTTSSARKAPPVVVDVPWTDEEIPMAAYGDEA